MMDAGQLTVTALLADAMNTPGRGVQVARMVPIGRVRMPGAARVDG